MAVISKGGKGEAASLRGRSVAVGMIILAALGATLLLAGQAEALTVSGDIRTPATWTLADSPVVVTGDVRVVNSTTLTIQAGVEVRFKPGTGLSVGALGAFGDTRDRGAILVQGTQADPVRFVSEAGARDWDGFVLDGRRNPDLASTISFLEVRGSSSDGITLRDIGTNLTSVTASGNARDGLVLASASPAITGSTFADNGAFGIHGDTASSPILDAVAFSGNQRPFRLLPGLALSALTFTGHAVPELDFHGGEVLASRTWARHTDTTAGVLQYRILGSVLVANQATLTLEPGVTLRFAPNAVLEIGRLGRFNNAQDRGGLLAEGTALQPIVLTRDGAALWGGVVFDGRRDPELPSTLRFVTLERATRGARMINTGPPNPVFEDATLRFNTDGMSVESSCPVVRRTTFADNTNYGLLSDSASCANVADSSFLRNGVRGLRGALSGPMAGLTFDGNLLEEIELWGTGDLRASTTLPRFTATTSGAALPYVLLSDTAVRVGATLTVDPGVTLRFRPGVELRAGTFGSGSTIEWRGAIHAVGTPSMPILFTSDNGVQGWDGLILDGRATPSQPSTFEHATIELSNRFGVQALGYTPGTLVFRNAVIRDNAGHGLEALSNARPLLEASTIQRSGSHGVWSDSTAGPDFEGATLEDNQWPLRVRAQLAPQDPAKLTLRGHRFDVLELVGHEATGSFSIPVHRDAATDEALPWRVLGTLQVDNQATLTILPGVTLQFDSSLYIGHDRWCSFPTQGGLNAAGTEAAPILLTSWTGRSEWDGVFVDGTLGCGGGRIPVRLANTTIEKSRTYLVGIREHNLVELDRVTLRQHGGSWAVDVQDGSAAVTLRDVTFEDVVRPFRISPASVVERPVVGASVAREVHIYGGDLTVSRTWGVQDQAGNSFAYVVASTVQVHNGAVLTLQPGLEVRFEPGAQLRIGRELNQCQWESQIPGGLHAVGTAAQPILLTSRTGAQDWDGLRFSARCGTVAATSTLANVTVEKVRGASGSWDWNRDTAVAVDAYGLLTLADVTIRDNPTFGMRIYQAAPKLERVRVLNNGWTGLVLQQSSSEVVDLVAQANGFAGDQQPPWNADLRNDGVHIYESSHAILRNARADANADFGVQVDSGSYPAIRDGGFAGNRRPARLHLDATTYTNTFGASMVGEIDLWGDAITQDRTLRALPNGQGTFAWRFLGTVLVHRGATLTVEPGLTVRFNTNTQLQVGQCTNTINWGWGMSVNPCGGLFDGGEAGNEGGLVAAGTAEAPITFTSLGPGSTWNGILLDGRRTPALPSTLRFVTVERSNGDGLHALRHAALTIDDSTFRDNGDDGLELQAYLGTLPRLALLRNGDAGIEAFGGTPTLVDARMDGNRAMAFRASGGRLDIGPARLTFEGASAASGSARIGQASPVVDLRGLSISAMQTPEVLITAGAVQGAGALRAMATDEGTPVTYRVLPAAGSWSGAQQAVFVPAGSSLVIEPGVVVRVDPGASIVAASCASWWNNDECRQFTTPAGRLTIEGTPEAPIAIRSATGNRDWTGLQAWGGAPFRLRDATVEGASGAALTVVSNADVAVERATLRSSGQGLSIQGSGGTYADVDILDVGGDGLALATSSGTFTGVAIERAGGYGLTMDGASTGTFDGLRIEASGLRPLRASVHVALRDVTLGPHASLQPELMGGTVTTNAAVERLTDAAGATVPWQVLGDIQVVSRATLTIDPGAELRFNPGTGIEAGRLGCNQSAPWNPCQRSPDDGGAVQVLGTPELPVTLTSYRSRPDWDGLRIVGAWTSGTQPRSIVRDAVVELTSGNAIHLVSVDSPALDRVAIRDAGGAGLVLEASRGSFTDLAIRGSAGAAVFITEAPFCQPIQPGWGSGGGCANDFAGPVTIDGATLQGGQAHGLSLVATAGHVVTVRDAAILDNDLGALRVQGPARAVVEDAALPLGEVLVRAVQANAPQRFLRSTVGGQAFAGDFTPLTVGTLPLTLSVEDAGQRRRVLLEDGPQGSRWTHAMGSLFGSANYTYRAQAVDDGRVTQGPARLRSDAAGVAGFDTLLDGQRRAVLDVIPEVFLAFDWSPRGPASPTDIEDVTFADRTLVRYADVVDRTWTFGDGALGKGDGAAHRYADDGVFLVNLALRLNDAEATTTSLTLPVEIFNVPATPDWGYEPARPTILDDVRFRDRSVDPDGQVISWRWEFGDGGTSTQQHPTHKYPQWGDFNVLLRVRDDDLASSTLVRSFHVWSFDELLVATAQDSVAMGQAHLLSGQTDAEALLRDAQAAVDEQVVLLESRVGSLEADTQAQVALALAQAEATAQAKLAALEAVAAAGDPACFLAAAEAALGMAPSTGAALGCAIPLVEDTVMLAEQEKDQVLQGVPL